MYIWLTKIQSNPMYVHMKHAKNRFYVLVLGIYVIFSLSSCAHGKKLTYFRDLSDTTQHHLLDSIRNFEATIQTGDVLDIYIASRNPQTSAAFNLGNVTTVSSSSPVQATDQPTTGPSSPSLPRGYTVEADGTIELPVLGKLPAAGCTIPFLRDTIKARLENYMKMPFVTIRFLNYKITVLGEVAHPSSYLLSGDRTTVIDALGMAGDLTIFGKRKNVLVIREAQGARTYARLDLSSSKIFESPYFYLKQNDIVYVEPNKTRELASSDKLLRAVTIGGSLFSVLVSALLLFKL